MFRRWMPVLLLAAWAPQTLAQEDTRPGGFGITIAVDGEGFFLNPTLKPATVQSVVAGPKARQPQPMLKMLVGHTLRLELRQPASASYLVNFLATDMSK